MGKTPEESIAQYEDVDVVYGYIAHDDPFVMVLRVHIHMERIFNALILNGRTTTTKQLDDIKFNWGQKLSLVRMLGNALDKLEPSLRKLNAIRNALSHGKSNTVTKKQEHEFWTSLPRSMREGMLEYWAGEHGAPYDLERPHALLRFGLLLTWLSLEAGLRRAERSEKRAELRRQLERVRRIRSEPMFSSDFKPGELERREREILAQLEVLNERADTTTTGDEAKEG